MDIFLYCTLYLSELVLIFVFVLNIDVGVGAEVSVQ